MGCRPTMKIECAYGESKAETKGYCLSKLTGLRVVSNLEAVCCVRFHETMRVHPSSYVFQFPL